METQGLSQEKILELLAPKPTHVSTHSPNNINGPLRYTDSGLRCASKGCSSPTHYKVEGIPRCYTHALYSLNELVVEMDNVIKLRTGRLT